MVTAPSLQQNLPDEVKIPVEAPTLPDAYVEHKVLLEEVVDSLIKIKDSSGGGDPASWVLLGVGGESKMVL